MKCPYCRAESTDVFNSRPTKLGNQIWRRRRCLSCHESFTTYEAADLGFMSIMKRSGKRQTYSRAKLFGSIYAAFAVTPQKQDEVDAITDTIESKILDLQQPIITSTEVAATVLQTLKHYNTSAFVRYLANQTDLINEAQLRKELKKY